MRKFWDDYGSIFAILMAILCVVGFVWLLEYSNSNDRQTSCVKISTAPNGEKYDVSQHVFMDFDISLGSYDKLEDAIVAKVHAESLFVAAGYSKDGK